MYGSEVLFIGEEISDFEMVHLSFLKNMLGIKQQTTSVAIYEDTGRYPLFVKQQILALKYWIRLTSLPKSCYFKIVYNSLASLDFIVETNWCSHIRSLLFRTNHRYVWLENANRLSKQVKLCLIIICKSDWSNKARAPQNCERTESSNRPLARRISVLHPRHKVDKGTIKIKNELTC